MLLNQFPKNHAKTAAPINAATPRPIKMPVRVGVMGETMPQIEPVSLERLLLGLPFPSRQHPVQAMPNHATVAP